MSALIVCRGCGAAWIDPDCTCTCEEEGEVHYEDLATIDLGKIVGWIAKQRVGYRGGVRWAVFDEKPEAFGGLTLIDFIAALTFALQQQVPDAEQARLRAIEEQATRVVEHYRWEAGSPNEALHLRAIEGDMLDAALGGLIVALKHPDSAAVRGLENTR